MRGSRRFNLQIPRLITVTAKKKPTMTMTYPRQKKKKKTRRLKKHNQSRHVAKAKANEVLKLEANEMLKAPVQWRHNVGTQKKKWRWLNRILIFLKMLTSGTLNDEKNSGRGSFKISFSDLVGRIEQPTN